MPCPGPRLLVPAVRDYAWGSHEVIARLQGRPTPTAAPEAEAWFGAHPAAPAEVVDGDARRPLTDVLAADPRAELGDDVVAGFEGRLPYLVKLLAAEAPLSLQAHPSASQAAAGFAADEALGIPVDAPDRRYRDAWPKPELLYALTPFTALCGFRGPRRTAALLDALDVPRLAGLRARLDAEDQAALPPAISWALREGRAEAAAALPQLRAGAARLAARLGPGTARVVPTGADDPDTWWGVAARWLVALIDRYPDDPGVVVALLLRIVELEPGEVIALPAGNLHAYLSGAGVEVMASSDNVLRGGLTAKHVDVDALLDVVDPRFLPAPVVPGEAHGPEVVHPTGTPHFRFSHLPLTATPIALDRRGPEVLLVVGGSLRVEADGAGLTVPSGHAAFVAASCRRVTVAGEGRLFRTTPGDLAGRPADG